MDNPTKKEGRFLLEEARQRIHDGDRLEERCGKAEKGKRVDEAEALKLWETRHWNACRHCRPDVALRRYHGETYADRVIGENAKE